MIHSVKIEGLKVFAPKTEETEEGEELDPSITKDLVVRTEVEFGPILGQKNTKDEEFNFYTLKPMKAKCELKYDDNEKIMARAIFQGADDTRRTAVRPSLYSHGRIRILPIQQGGATPGKEMLREWDVTQITKISLTLDIEFTLQDK